MKTQKRITIIISTCAATVVLAAAVAVLAWGWNGVLISAMAVVAAAVAYVDLLRPWHTTWGATTDEILGDLPGDGLVDGERTTRAITIHAAPEAVWPWLVQIGYGKAGWYSYDWIDNDGRPSATTTEDRWQDLHPGDRIPMTPDLAFTVTEISPQHHIVSRSEDGSTSWTLAISPCPPGTRLISRFTTKVTRSPAAVAWMVIVDPGAFIMERRMLKGIRHRAQLHPGEQATRAHPHAA